MTITRQQIFTMLKLQDEMNSIVNPDWRNAGYNWPRAIMVEAVEAIEHAAWKWWKKQVPDMPQVQMELVDIWHFALSLMMQNTVSGDNFHELNSIAQDVSDRPLYEMDKSNKDGQIRLSSVTFIRHKDIDQGGLLIDDLQAICGAAASGLFDVKLFEMALTKAGMSWQDLYKTYISKNCLNRFRQTHGYKTGEYIKDWSDMPLIQSLTEKRALEDNDHLHDIVQQIDTNRADLFDVLTTELSQRYQFVKRSVISA